MKLLVLLFMFAFFFVYGMMYLVMAIHGLFKGNIYYTPGQKPIKFDEERFRFITQLLVTLFICVICFIAAFFTIRKIIIYYGF